MGTRNAITLPDALKAMLDEIVRDLQAGTIAATVSYGTVGFAGYLRGNHLPEADLVRDYLDEGLRRRSQGKMRVVYCDRALPTGIPSGLMLAVLTGGNVEPFVLAPILYGVFPLR